jgi:uncharacterized protein YecE (DUF72 family)
VLCHTDLEGAGEQPTLRVTGRFLYLRLRRDDYGPAELEAWAQRLQPFLADGLDVYAFFKHDPVGRAGALALDLSERLADYRPA